MLRKFRDHQRSNRHYSFLFFLRTSPSAPHSLKTGLRLGLNFSRVEPRLKPQGKAAEGMNLKIGESRVAKFELRQAFKSQREHNRTRASKKASRRIPNIREVSASILSDYPSMWVIKATYKYIIQTSHNILLLHSRLARFWSRYSTRNFRNFKVKSSESPSRITKEKLCTLKVLSFKTHSLLHTLYQRYFPCEYFSVLECFTSHIAP